ncbi:MAG TPA: dTDP-4-dehydrorhamnose 3,5-epimerase family protein [Spirochaetota bacterium]|nr:dTDP-4-dehydrorhamnose 3,5-epimerase family protein [Spirochaetota bacterium]
MKLLSVTQLAIPEIKVIRYARFCDHRGYFTESYRKSDFFNPANLPFMKGLEFLQVNESFSRPKTVRGLHFQWNPFMGKLVRTIRGHMVDIVLDVRKGSPTFGRAILYDMPDDPARDFNEWIWVPPGFAHGNYYKQESQIEYFCTGEYSQGCEAGISPLAGDIDWSLCDKALKKEYDAIVKETSLITDKDRNGFTLASWQADGRSDNFIYGKC